jgi:hypothetical protein
MEKVQVDIRKLQLLNDRINQTIDALSQLRLTAQAGVGLSHTNAVAGYTTPFASPFGVTSYANPYLQQAFVPQVGFQHTPWIDPAASMYLRSPFGLNHSTFGLMAGAIDPIARQWEIARANEENRRWELTQGLSHSPLVNTPFTSTVNPYFAAAQYGVGFGPFVG